MAENEGYTNEEECTTSFTNENETPNEQDNGKHGNSETNEAVSFSQEQQIGPYAGMPKEVLLQYSRQKKFVWAREILTTFVFITILVLLALVIAIIAISPPCLEFWQTSPIYQIYPKSFYSTEGRDGYGDIKGITEKLDYLSDDLGISVLALNSIFESPQLNNGYDVSNFKKVDPIFGATSDLETLVFEAHNRGMKLVIDFVPNHSSDKHEWFLASSNTSHRYHEKYKEFYIWVDGDDENDVPNNWVKDIGTGSAWTWNDNRKQFYYHSYSEYQPDLNLRNKDVRDELKDILRFWLSKGVDGFRFTGVDFLLEADHLRDNPVINESQPISKANTFPDYTQNYHGVNDIVAEWRALLNEYSTEPGVYRYLETQSHADVTTTIRYYGNEFLKEADMSTNNILVEAEDWKPDTIRNAILNWMRKMPENRWPNWMLGNHDSSRLVSRLGVGTARCAATLAMTLPGTPLIYYGDELGMTDNAKKSSETARTPMQWSIDKNAGFCTNCTPWAAVNENYLQGITVQNETGDEYSFLSLYRKLISLRSSDVFQRGYFCMLESTGDNLVYVRELSGIRSMMVLINLMNETGQKMDLTTKNPNLPQNGVIEFFTGSDTVYHSGNNINFDDLNLPAKSAMVVSFDGGEEMFNERKNVSTSCFINLRVCYNNALQIVQTC